VPLYLKGDPGKIRQIVTNLVGNALKFTQQGTVYISASLASEQNGIATILFEVHDTGIGIPESRLGAVFEPFTQASGSTARKYGGTGLGLAICRQLAKLMGGEIGATSEEGRGSTFWFTARLEKQTSPTPKVHSNIIPAAPVKIVNRNARILLAEDNITNQVVAKAILGRLGYKADTVANGIEAVQALELINYDLVLMDCQMPEMDGFEATALIRDSGSKVLNHDVPIVAMTAAAITGDREKCLASGMNDYISKPLYKNELAQILGKWLTYEATGGKHGTNIGN
jgi:CheY-like chemotaxis protein